MRVDVLIIVSDMAVDLLMDVLTALMRGVLTNIDVDVLAGVNANKCWRNDCFRVCHDNPTGGHLPLSRA